MDTVKCDFLMLIVTDEHDNEFVCSTNNLMLDKDVTRFSVCEIYRYDISGKVCGLAYPAGKNSGYHNRVKVVNTYPILMERIRQRELGHRQPEYGDHCSYINDYSAPKRG